MAELKDTVNRCLNKHHKEGTLSEQTPRMIREEVARELGIDLSKVDEEKGKIKQYITLFVESVSKSSASSSEEEDDEASTLRRIAKMIGVPPSFWSGINKNDSKALKTRLLEFCDTKSVQRSGEIPTLKEAKQFQSKREQAAEMEGINSANILTGKRRRFDLPF